MIEESKTLDSVDSLLKIMDSNMYEGRWMFRGVKNYSYELIPSVGRLLNTPNFKDKNTLLKFEESAFNEFYIQTYSQLKVDDKFTILAIAQHHGLKTRLLDWTLSPLIALFFAVEDLSNTDGALYAIQSQWLFNDFKNLASPFDESLDDYHFLSAPDFSKRISAQQGVFQLFKYPTEPFDEHYNLLKFRIPKQNKRSIFKQLFALGVSYRSLYPDFDGISKSINYFKLNDK